MSQKLDHRFIPTWQEWVERFNQIDDGSGGGGSASIQALLDSITAVQGSVLYRGPASWVGLPPGIAGQLLQTGGPAANPSWVTAGSSPGLPATVPNLAFWFKSDPILSASGSTVHSLQNYTPWYTALSAQNTGSGGTISATLVNGLRTTNFPASGAGHYNLDAVFSLPVSTIFAVYRPLSFTGTASFICGNAASLQFRVETSGKLGLIQTATAGIGTSTGALTIGTASQMNATYDSGSGAWAFRIARAGSGSGSVVRAIGQPETVIGFNPTSPGEDLAGDLGELIVYDRVLTGPEITSVENYLFGKWNV